MTPSTYLFPLRETDGSGTLLPFLASRPAAHGVPDQLPEPPPRLPTVLDVARTFRSWHCHGIDVVPLEDGFGDQPFACSDFVGCRNDWLGEVTLDVGDALVPPLLSHQRVEFVSCRGAQMRAALVAAWALARETGGPWVVLRDVDGSVCVACPDDDPNALAAAWAAPGGPA